jgi:hypothetical protein
MHDDLDLSVIDRHHDADPTYRAALRQQLASILDGTDAHAGDGSPTDPATIGLAGPPPEQLRRDWRRWAVAAVAMGGAAAMIIALVIVDFGDDRREPAVQSPLPTTPTVDQTVPTTQPAPIDQTVTTTQPAPVDQTVSTSQPAPVDQAVPTTQVATTQVPEAPSETPQLFTEIAPGSMVSLPDAPIGTLAHPGGVWTGTEMIVWGGFEGDGQRSAAGAAFDLAAGTWRVIAPAPISGRSEAAMVWTGTEMLVWGGSVADDTSIDDGAAYDPATDTWRVLPAAPITESDDRLESMVWTGDEAIVLTEAAAAYDPITNSWRRLADPPSYGYPAKWTGTSLITINGGLLSSYDVNADEWSAKSIGRQAEVVAVPGGDGHMIALPTATGARTQILDSSGKPVAELAAFPGDPDLFGETIGAAGWSVGDEVVLWIWTGEFPYEYEQLWALDLTTNTWRQLDDTATIEPVVVTAGDVLLGWGGTGPGGAPLVETAGFAYRADAASAG